MICALCKLREANKKNTHYLTDGIIRSCLNQGGSKEREKGLYFDLSNDTPFVNFNFQRNTSVAEVEDTLGREINNEEIDKAKKVPFSVDDVFCNVCEDIFTAIESEFIDKILPSLRGADLSKTDRVIIPNVKLARLFFYLQIWRTSVCRDEVKISDAVADILRLIILGHDKVSLEEINQFPIVVTYLETLGGEEEYTTNVVGLTNNTGPNLIFMNDFFIQFYENIDSVSWFDFYGLNDQKSYMEFVNYANNQFIFDLFHNKKRKQLIHDMLYAEKVEPSVDVYKSMFIKGWQLAFNELPSELTQQEFFDEATSNERALGTKYTKEQFLNEIVAFVDKYAN